MNVWWYLCQHQMCVNTGSVWQDGADAELKGACGFTPHPPTKVCLSHMTLMILCARSCVWTLLNLCFQDGERFDDLKGAFGHELKVEQTSRRAQGFRISVCSLISLISLFQTDTLLKSEAGRSYSPNRVQVQTLYPHRIWCSSAHTIAHVTPGVFPQRSYSNGVTSPAWDSKVRSSTNYTSKHDSGPGGFWWRGFVVFRQIWRQTSVDPRLSSHRQTPVRDIRWGFRKISASPWHYHIFNFFFFSSTVCTEESKVPSPASQTVQGEASSAVLPYFITINILLNIWFIFFKF